MVRLTRLATPLLFTFFALSGCSMFSDPQVRLVNDKIWWVQVGIGDGSSSGTFSPEQTLVCESTNNENNVYKEISSGEHVVAFKVLNGLGIWTSWTIGTVHDFQKGENYSIVYTSDGPISSAQVTVMQE